MPKKIILLMSVMASISFAQTSGYLPLDVGNEWLFNNSSVKIKILSEKEINGKMFKQIYRPAPSFDTLYMRYQASKVYLYSFQSSTEELLYDFTVPAGTIFFQSGGYSRKCVLNDTITYLNKKTRIWTFSSGLNCIDCTYYENIVDSVGWQELSGAFYTFRLSEVWLSGNRIVTSAQHHKAKHVHTATIDVFPNPFNPSTTITYSLPAPNIVEIILFDVLGQKIEEIYSGNSQEGENIISFNGKHLPSGIYFVRLKSADIQMVTKIQILK